MDWQPIETAPKDGESWIIAWDGKLVLPLIWHDADEFETYTGWCSGSKYWGGTLYDGVNEVSQQPTHWMPLPEAHTMQEDKP